MITFSKLLYTYMGTYKIITIIIATHLEFYKINNIIIDHEVQALYILIMYTVAIVLGVVWLLICNRCMTADKNLLQTNCLIKQLA